ncbi:MAG: hypothetical protein J1F16_08080 [Muribaculaceae bacterium]|nr:hypothetical protein [Muribaculaceae bacterium]
MKKKLTWLISALVVGLASCSQDSLLNEDGLGSEIITTIGVKAPEAIGSRSVPDVFGNNPLAWNGESGYPSIGNVDLQNHPLSYTVGIYIGKETAGQTVYSLVEKQDKTGVASDEAYFNFRLIKGQTYKIVAYADFASTAKDDLENISYKTDLNNELDDAFFVSEDFVAKEHVAAVLKRPFGKLRLIAHDFNTFTVGEKFEIKGVSVSYKGQPMLASDTFNALTGDFNYDNTEEGDHTYNSAPVSYALEYDATGKASYAAVFTHYLPANFGDEDLSGTYAPVNSGLAVPQSWFYPFEVSVNYTDEKGENPQTLTRNYDIDIPVKRNWLTTVDVENFWTDNSNIKVTVDHRFDGFINEEHPKVEYVYNEDQLQASIEKFYGEGAKAGKIILGCDITMDHTDTFEIWDEEGDLTITLDLNGKTIEQKTPEAYSVLNVVGGYYTNTLIIEDSSKESTGAILSIDKEACIGTQTIWAEHGGKVIINGGIIKCCEDNSAIYACDEQKVLDKYGFPGCEIIINGGWIENIDGTRYAGDTYMEYLQDALVNIKNDEDVSVVHINGGSYVGFDPRNGDNKCGNKVNQWVDDDHYVVEETINGNTVYTVLAKENPSYY